MQTNTSLNRWRFLVIVTVAVAMMAGCKKDSTNPVGDGGVTAFDTNLIGVWWSSVDLEGVHILTDGTAYPLKSSSGKIEYDTVGFASESFSMKVSTANGQITMTSRMKSPATNKDTTMVEVYTYTITNNTTLTISGLDHQGLQKTTIYERKSIGDPVTTATGLTASKTSVSLQTGTNTTSVISGGVTPYSIKTAPNASVATAAISGSTVTITGMSAGTTSLVVKDASVPEKTITISVTVTSSSTSLTASVNPLTVNAGSSGTTTISGGTAPYSITTQPTSSIATASINSSVVTVNGVAAGSTSLVVSDNSSPKKTVTLSVTVTSSSTSLTASVNPVTVNAGGTGTTTISGGTTPYSITTQPTNSIATASINSNVVTINGVATGSTSLVVSDNSSPKKSVTVSITISSGGFSTAGAISFNSTAGNFSVNGTYNEAAISGGGAGGYFYSYTSFSQLEVTGYRFNSATNIDLVVISFYNPSGITIGPGTYSFTPTGTATYVTVVYLPNSNLNDTTNSAYFLMSGAGA
ncbi:MAG: hypothetical protein NTV54_01555, partial [Ignavibacteriales bacterium]|nr:hypothetical protein [Ignavibacteriales bacterium]